MREKISAKNVLLGRDSEAMMICSKACQLQLVTMDDLGGENKLAGEGSEMSVCLGQTVLVEGR
jgi:hypothetical protein